jgi:hypothetical protein
MLQAPIHESFKRSREQEDQLGREGIYMIYLLHILIILQVGLQTQKNITTILMERLHLCKINITQIQTLALISSIL